MELPDVDGSNSLGTKLSDFFGGIKIFSDASNSNISFGKKFVFLGCILNFFRLAINPTKSNYC